MYMTMWIPLSVPEVEGEGVLGKGGGEKEDNVKRERGGQTDRQTDRDRQSE